MGNSLPYLCAHQRMRISDLNVVAPVTVIRVVVVERAEYIFTVWPRYPQCMALKVSSLVAESKLCQEA